MPQHAVPRLFLVARWLTRVVRASPLVWLLFVTSGHAADLAGDMPSPASGGDTAVLRAWMYAGLFVVAFAALGLWWHLSQLRRQIAAKHRAIEQAEAYLGFLTHEVRNALQSVVGASVLFNELESEGAATPEERRKLLDLMMRSSRSTMTLMDALMDRYRYTRGAIDIELQDVDVAELLEQLTQDMQSMAYAKKLALGFDCGKGAGGPWRVDPVRVQQVVRNLMVNAIKFTRQGSVAVRLQVEQPDAASSKQRLLISVSDTGDGLDEHQLKRVFTSFQTEGGDRPGSGLGLVLCQDLAKAMGGSISVISQPGQGSEFTLTFDAERPAHLSELPVVELSMGSILIVDGSAVYGLLLKRAFEQQRARVELLESVREVGESLASGRASAHDLVLIDVTLPDGGFADVVELLDRHCAFRPHVVVMRQDASSEDNPTMERLRVVESIIKTSDVYSLVDRVEQMYQAAQMRRFEQEATLDQTGRSSSPAKHAGL